MLSFENGLLALKANVAFRVPALLFSE